MVYYQLLPTVPTAKWGHPSCATRKSPAMVVKWVCIAITFSILERCSGLHGSTMPANIHTHSLRTLKREMTTHKARHLQATQETPAPAPPAEYPQSVDIFSALHDTVNGEVRVFAAVYPSTKCTDIKFCRYSVEEEFSEDTPAGTLIPFEVAPGNTVDCILSCQLHVERTREAPPVSSVTLLDEQRNELHAFVPIEKLEVAGIGYKGVGMCLGPFYSYVPQFLDWLTHWSRFGIAGIHAYVPLYDQDQPVAKELGQGQPYRRPPLLMHHLLSWLTYKPVPRSDYHAQRLIYNDCIYRHRHLYDFIVVMDSDEFIYFHPEANYTETLRGWMLRNTNEDSAGLCFQEYESPPVRCYHHLNRPINRISKQEQEEKVHYSIRYKGYKMNKEMSGPLPAPLKTCTDRELCRLKCVVRPLAVRAYNVHGPQHLEEGWEACADVDPALALYKHIRCKGGGAWE
eukprot:jgi/Botrbrau1/11305/Bobra.0038s0067.2